MIFNQQPKISPIQAIDKTGVPVEVKLLTDTKKVFKKHCNGQAK